MTTTHQEQQQQHYGNINNMTNEIASQHQHCNNDKNKTRATKASQKGQQQINNKKLQMK